MSKDQSGLRNEFRASMMGMETLWLAQLTQQVFVFQLPQL